VGEDVTYAKRNLKDYEAEGIIADLHLHSTDYFEKSRGEFEAILQKDPQNADANRGLGYWYMRKDDLDKAEEYFQKAAKLGSTDARVHYLVAQALYRKGERDAQTLYDMMQSLQTAIKYDRDFAEAYNLEGYVYSSMRDYPNAIEAVRTAVRLNPRNEHFQMNLAQQYMTAEKYDDAIFVFNKLKDSPDQSIAENATRLMATAHELKEKPLLRLSTREQPKDDSQEIQSSADSEELKAMEARQRGEDTSKPDSRPMKYVTGKLVGVDCSKQPSAILRVSQGQKIYKFMAPSVSKMLVIGANEFSCLWKDRKVSVNYRESGPLQGDVVSVEVY
jgi:tetratricopeptide (TPR) repeat protein